MAAKVVGSTFHASSCPRRSVKFLLWFLVAVLGCGGVFLAAVLIRTGENPTRSTLKPVVGEMAPDFALKDVDGLEFRLSERAGQTPVVLEFGSYTCPYCMATLEPMKTLARKYEGKIEFVIIYCREAHPEMRSMEATGDLPVLDQTNNREERADRATRFGREMKVPQRILVDEDGEDSIQQRYGELPNQTIVVDVTGVVRSMGNTDPWKLDSFLQENVLKGAFDQK
jgi:thiol-disulfide isomerase/thioredoxin